MSRGSGSTEGKRKQVSREGHKCTVRGQVTCGSLWVTYVTRRRLMTHRQLYQFYLLLLKIVLSFSLPSFLASALAPATSSLELGRSFRCRSNRTLTLSPAFETANPPGTSSQDTALPPNPAPRPQPWSLLSSCCAPPGASQGLVTHSSVGRCFQPLITTPGLHQFPLHPSQHLLVGIYW